MSGVDALHPPFSVPRPGRTVTDVLRRGFDSAIANWPVLVVRVAETMLMGLMVVATAIMVIVPLVVSIGISAAELQNTIQSSDNPAQVITELIAGHWLILVYILVAISLALLVMVGVHSFVMAGTARIFVIADRVAGAAPATRQRFAVFSMDAWFAGGREAWWPVFWIYNIAYGIAGIVILLPLLPIALLIAIFQQPTAAIVLSCLGLLILVSLSIVVMVVTNIVCQKAIVLAAQRPIDGTTALRQAWRAMREDFVRHFAVAFIMMVLVFGGTGVLTMLSLGFAAPGMAHPFAGLVFLPIRLVFSFASSVFSAVITSWFIASFAALSSEEA